MYTVRLINAAGTARTLYVRATGTNGALREALRHVDTAQDWRAAWILEGRL